MLDYWREWLEAALPLHLVVPFIIAMSCLYFGADYIYSAYKSSAAAEVVVEVADTVDKTLTSVSWEDVQDKPVLVSEVVHTVNQEGSRVLRI